MKRNNDRENFGNNLIKLRKTHKLTQKQMAQIMDCSVYCLRKAEQGIFVRTLYVDSVENLCRYFHISPCALFSPPE